MSTLLNNRPLILDKYLATLLGLNEALILQQVHYWLEINKKTIETTIKIGIVNLVTVLELNRLIYMIHKEVQKGDKDKSKWYNENR